MHIQDSEFDLDACAEPALLIEEREVTPKDAYEVRRLIERRAELRRLRDLLGEPDLEDFE